MGADPLDAVADRLYALPPDEFVAARDEAAAQAKKAGDRELTARIAKLRRPTVGAWLVNLLAHESPDQIAQLLQLGDQLRAAQRNLRGDEIRELSQRRREMVTALASRAAALGRRQARGNLPLDEVQATLTAALAEPEVAEQVRAGRLTKTVSYAGFGEPPRPQLRVLPGGRAEPLSVDAGRSTGDSGRTTTADRPTSQRGVRASGVDEPPARRGATTNAERRGATTDAERRGATTDAERRGATDAERRAAADDAERRAAEAERRAEEAERRAEEAERRAAERAAERAAAQAAQAQQRRERAAAHRELLAARTELAEAEAARTAAERAVTAARRRVEKATAALARLDAED